VTEDASTHRQQFAGRLLAVNCPAVVSYERSREMLIQDRTFY
jgi:hypothetical protein